MYSPYFKEVYVDRGVKNLKQTALILEKLNPKSINLVNDIDQIHTDNSSLNTHIGHSKRILFLTRQKGNFIKKFCDNKNLTNSGEYRIDLTSGCIFDCAYCYLQSYLTHHVITIYVNLNKFKDVFLSLKKQDNLRKCIFTTGELSDSLALEGLTGYAEFLINFFSNEDSKLELRTKSSQTEFLPKGSFRKDNISIFWTINPPYFIRRLEFKTPSLEERLSVIKRVKGSGVKIGLRLDPIFHLLNWEEEYENLINYIHNLIGQESEITYSLGCFRYTKELKGIIQTRFKDIKILEDEFIRCEDGKFRYFRDIRLKVYKRIKSLIRKIDKKAKITLCMEPQWMWDILKV